MFSRGKAEMQRQTLDENIAASTKIYAQAIDTGIYAISDVDEFLSDITAGAKVGAAVQMTSVTVSDVGEVDLADYTFTAITGATIEGVVYYMTHTALAQDLLLYYDDDANFTPDGNDVNVSYSSYVWKL
jgi:hypothetical protein